jgi:KaiC/GvpD/RAD55 family RecA-like ATPase
MKKSRTRTSSSLHEVYEGEHFVQFYENEERLLENLARFMDTGLAEGDHCVLVATEEHRQALEGRLLLKGADTERAKRERRYVALDADTVLSSFMDKYIPNKDRFSQVMGDLLQKVRLEGKQLRVFGEMVALLWAQSNEAAAIVLEQLWNDLAQDYDFTLFCGYPMHYFENQGYDAMLQNISRLHSSAIMAEPHLMTLD